MGQTSMRDSVDVTGVEIREQGRVLAVNSGDRQLARFHAIWLRDNALDSETRDPSNGQRYISVLDIPTETRIESAELSADDTLRIRFLPEGKTVCFPVAWLLAHRYDQLSSTAPGWISPEITLWDASLAGSVHSAELEDLRADPDALLQWLSAIGQFGFAKVSGIPCESGAVSQVVDLFGFVRETNYGRVFDVRAEIDPVNLAYTNLGLEAHTDNPYADPAPTLQLVACLENSAVGGESIVVDGFRAVQQLLMESPEGFDLLSNYCARFEYTGSEAVTLRSRRPMIELAPDGELTGLRFNNRAISPLVDIPWEAMPAYYAAYRKLAEIISRPEAAICFRLEPGKLFIIDNTRVLHARKSFSGAGSRWLQGCYADKDGLLSTLRVLQSQLRPV